MSRTLAPPTDPLAEAAWQQQGAEAGRRNEPRTPSGPFWLRTALETAWLTELQAERIAFLEALDALDQRRTNLRRHLHQVYAQAATDPRQASNLPTLQEQDRNIAAERVMLCDQFLTVIDSLTQQARACDVAWISENERHRDRRLTLDPTRLSLPPTIIDIPPDPFA